MIVQTEDDQRLRFRPSKISKDYVIVEVERFVNGEWVVQVEEGIIFPKAKIDEIIKILQNLKRQ